MRMICLLIAAFLFLLVAFGVEFKPNPMWTGIAFVTLGFALDGVPWNKRAG